MQLAHRSRWANMSFQPVAQAACLWLLLSGRAIFPAVTPTHRPTRYIGSANPLVPVEVRLAERQAGLDALLVNPDPAGRLGIAEARLLADMNLQLGSRLRNVHVGAVDHHVLLKTGRAAQRNVRRALQADRRADHRHTVERSSHAGDVIRRATSE